MPSSGPPAKKNDSQWQNIAVDPYVAAQISRGLVDKEDYVARLARKDYKVFCKYVFGADNQPLHDMMHDFQEKHKRTTIDCAIEHGKTTHTSIFKPMWKIGRNVMETIAIMSSTDDLPQKALRVIKEHLERNPKYGRVFPEVQIEKATNEYIRLARPLSTQKDMSLIAVGIEGNILGKRWTILASDDIIRFQTQWTEHERNKLTARFFDEAYGRLTWDAYHYDVGTPWHVSDTRHVLRKMPDYQFLRFDAWTGEVRGKNNELIHKFPEGCLWPQVVVDKDSGQRYGWPHERLLERKTNMLRLPDGASKFDRQFRSLALSGSLEVFSRVDLEQSKARATGIEFREWTEFNDQVRVARRRRIPEECDLAVTGVDLAISKRDTSGQTAFFTVWPHNGQKILLDIRKGKMEGPQIMRTILSIAKALPMHRGFRVENNATQEFIIQFAKDRVVMKGIAEAEGYTSDEIEQLLHRIQVESHTTTSKNKNSPEIGIRGLAMDFESDRFPIPCDNELTCTPLVEEWYQAMLAYDPKSHPDDMLMASWFAWEECRLFGYGTALDTFGAIVPKG